MANTDLEPQGGIFTATVLPQPAGHGFLIAVRNPNTQISSSSRQLQGSWWGSLLPISDKNFEVFWRCLVEIKKPPTSPASITFKVSSTIKTGISLALAVPPPALPRQVATICT